MYRSCISEISTHETVIVNAKLSLMTVDFRIIYAKWQNVSYESYSFHLRKMAKFSLWQLSLGLFTQNTKVSLMLVGTSGIVLINCFWDYLWVESNLDMIYSYEKLLQAVAFVWKLQDCTNAIKSILYLNQYLLVSQIIWDSDTHKKLYLGTRSLGIWKSSQ